MLRIKHLEWESVPFHFFFENLSKRTMSIRILSAKKIRLWGHPATLQKKKRFKLLCLTKWKLQEENCKLSADSNPLGNNNGHTWLIGSLTLKMFERSSDITTLSYHLSHEIVDSSVSTSLSQSNREGGTLKKKR